MCRTILCLVAIAGLASTAAAQQTREQKVLGDRKTVEAEGYWIYNDLPKATEQAKQTGKPLLVVMRCIPCTECVKLDDDLINRDEHVRPLLDKFVCCRVVSTNGLDLATFQFDTDQSFAVFMLNADGAVYGRFGTRSHQTKWADDVSIEGLGQALAGALELHAGYPGNKQQLAGKRGPKPEHPTPAKMPFLRDKYGPEITYEKNVVQSCIHCHQIGDAERKAIRQRDEPLPERLLFPYPHPRTLGLTLDPQAKARVLAVAAGSIAAKAGIQTGDEIAKLHGQPLLSIGDVQWVLHQAAPEGAKLTATIVRDGKPRDVTLELPAGWRRSDDISWRVSTWQMRAYATGGLLLVTPTEDERKDAGVAADAKVVKVKHVGQYNEHAAAKNAGFQQNDFILEFDGQQFGRESDLIAHAMTKRKAGEKVPVTVLRGGKKLQLTLPMQK